MRLMLNWGVYRVEAFSLGDMALIGRRFRNRRSCEAKKMIKRQCHSILPPHRLKPERMAVLCAL